MLVTLRNVVIGLAHLTGHANIAAATRHYAHDVNHVIELLDHETIT